MKADRVQRFTELIREMEIIAQERDAEFHIHNQLGFYTEEELNQRTQEYIDKFRPKLIGFINEGIVDRVLQEAVILLMILETKNVNK